jgi:hypothetical protein
MRGLNLVKPRTLTRQVGAHWASLFAEETRQELEPVLRLGNGSATTISR